MQTSSTQHPNSSTQQAQLLTETQFDIKKAEWATHMITRQLTHQMRKQRDQLLLDAENLSRDDVHRTADKLTQSATLRDWVTTIEDLSFLPTPTTN